MNVRLTSPGPTLGVVGGGQLGRMLGEAAGPLGIEIVVLDPTPDCPASPVVNDQIVGEFDDPDGLRELAERADVLTFEIELADPELLETVHEETGVPVEPSPSTLRTIQDKLVQKRSLAEAEIPVPEFRRVDSVEDLREAGEELGWPLMLKARRGGYDGRGNVAVDGPEEADDAMAEIGGDAMVEAFVPFDRELSVIGVKGEDTTDAFPVTETIHKQEILRETVTPPQVGNEADQSEIERRAYDVASDVLDQMEGRGVYGIELFEVNGRILVNEIAPRPHNSGHWTIEGAITSQFEQHVRAVMGWPLGTTDRRCPTVTTNILGGVAEPRPAELTGVETVLAGTNANLHWYGKQEVRPLRKMGHITTTGTDPNALLKRTRDLRDAVSFETPE
ncbi:5-(carboxyamino)imidazole ribonucleotide synthase [Halocatena pleomorpha]|uniref:N5-carboxyaminoimidazole ribonucleotide synthase n=1 Tax=Halocatena pleomorpha TaxID=1785090 RepID=A0A3P3R4Q3_9EURY|nr:5-(carboxyamino)imidazole ribonucleotide synthase [Halocatena pleomorpha]RRJ27938.1 5-(carboxyamino)imidazole ribonucleotide synthase [Halocatena pleomorpha]